MRNLDNIPWLYLLHTRRKWRHVLRRRRKETGRQYVTRLYTRRFGREPDLDNPTLYTEKMQWMKLFHHNPLYTKCADKHLARDYVANMGFSDILIPQLGAYTDPSQIDFDALPDKFVIKASHGCKWNLVCTNKETLRKHWRTWQKIMSEWLRQDFGLFKFETHYSAIVPRLVIEEYLESDRPGVELEDYKFFCFDGEVKFIGVNHWKNGKLSRNYYNTEWQRIEIKLVDYPNFDEPVPRPEHLERMLEISRRMSAEFPMVRVDLYQTQGRIYFGENLFFLN